jgi:hypothetical protein
VLGPTNAVMPDDEIEAALAAVHDATPGGFI